MTRTKTILALSAALSLIAAPMAIAADGTTLGGGANTQMKGGGNKTDSGMMKKGGSMSGTNKPGAATTLGGKTKGAS